MSLSKNYELLAIEHADHELRKLKTKSPYVKWAAKHPKEAFAFYWGIADIAIPETAMLGVETEMNAYNAGVLSRLLIDIGGQGPTCLLQKER